MKMAPKKGTKKAAGPAKTLRTIARPAKMEAKLSQLRELKRKFAGVAKALRPGSYFPSPLYLCSSQSGAPKHCLGTPVLPLKAEC